jgi:sterol desaturase/sphingolipid hydroxylase (fatty acid hydroxylase superfamily)
MQVVTPMGSFLMNLNLDLLFDDYKLYQLSLLKLINVSVMLNIIFYSFSRLDIHYEVNIIFSRKKRYIYIYINKKKGGIEFLST